jgi:uncharacterized protein YndB with AHSA1/START domain
MGQSSDDNRQAQRGGTRQQTHEIVIDAPPEAVWKAISDAEELTRWFVDQANVEPGVGGTFEVSWDGGEKGRSRIETWDPNQKLRLSKTLPGSAGAEGGEPAPMIQEYTIERRDGKTVLRLVHSGIPSAPEWDGFYNGTNVGWPSFFRTLRHYLEHHRGKARATIKVIGKLPGSLDDAWARVTGAGGFGFEPIAGQPFSITTGAGRPLRGTVVHVDSPGWLELTIRELDEAYLAHSMAAAGPKQFVYSVLSVFGKSDAEVEAIRAQWQPWLSGVLGINAVPTP